ncbi:hypothetical protein PHYBLDRAFT_152489 [Phycomyces blakesleeanus NRRL 1555(-)]|uniref:Uncharacterized protein n=1 Tax=Phycomyces blakesleeanus (strain ATCC 8743b / DSM 1359 / FGSC 10004 / NBRC 33097 / NRRL 1555) TaxID=763407 RepID=A0A167JP55_PHYB8|nr:hypothetical protein PHYBLDRAFT_152489 [Phycomyces blakesleeanus NRRL 1555(-)]OAD66418.1 hypothetical protein PHYBLDRAFT_152489 [Phycomyces blakesleeanus NRRL 1555(-)]|eukprot:XP_018284458.1 hypothetical protein PHYBLDRAFT_152489 [Phycomyces blakesleeanus NRRL 1555(-)]
MFACSCKNNCNIIVYNWPVGAVRFFLQYKNSHASLHFLVVVEVIKEHDAAANDSSVPIFKQRSQNNRPGRQT